MSPVDLSIAERVLKRFSHFCTATRLYVKQFFKDWDRLGRNKVSPKQFRQVLATVKFDMTDAEFKATADYFKSEDGYINYVDFIQATSDDLQSSLRVSPQQRASKNILNGNKSNAPTPQMEMTQTQGNNQFLFES